MDKTNCKDVRIEKYNYDGADYISISITENGKRHERSFETYPNDGIKTVLSLIETNLKIILNENR